VQEHILGVDEVRTAAMGGEAMPATRTTGHILTLDIGG
jgi:hypothetical protein